MAVSRSQAVEISHIYTLDKSSLRIEANHAGSYSIDVHIPLELLRGKEGDEWKAAIMAHLKELTEPVVRLRMALENEENLRK